MALHSRSPQMFVLLAGLSAKQSPFSIATITTSLVDRRSYHSRKRLLHSTSSKDIAIPITTPRNLTSSTAPSPAQAPPPLSTLSLPQILRTYLITSISSSPTLLSLSTSLLRRMLLSRNPLFRLDSNPFLRTLLKETFYKQFCAGATAPSITSACEGLRAQGYSGVILEYAAEILEQGKDASDSSAKEAADIAAWRQGMLASVGMAAPGDFVGLKWSGMGTAAMHRMKEQLPPTPAMEEAMHAVCAAARDREIALLPAAEETWNLAGYHAWTLGLQRFFNSNNVASSPSSSAEPPRKCVVYNTYQAYLLSARTSLAAHLALAEEENFTLGVKLVRGAYLGSEQERRVIWPSIEATHHSYDEILSALVQRKYNDFLQPAVKGENSASTATSATLPPTNVVLATHNAASVALAQRLRREQRARGEELTPLAFAQLQGMADEVSCGLLAASAESGKDAAAVKERVLKLTVWGTMTECLNYLLRRAAENKDAASRTSDTRRAMGREIGRRVKRVFGLA